MSQVDCISPLSDEHYKLSSLCRCQSSRAEATDSLCKLVKLLGIVQVNPISGNPSPET